MFTLVFAQKVSFAPIYFFHGEAEAQNEVVTNALDVAALTDEPGEVKISD